MTVLLTLAVNAYLIPIYAHRSSEIDYIVGIVD